MVVILQPNQYDGDAPEHLREHFNSFEYELSDFQKHAIEGIIAGQHTLSCIGTGSGKTLAALFAIKYLVGRGKKVIMTTPIKALSNTKFHEFTKRFPDISFGLITGDIKVNPCGDVIICTAEILANTLHRKTQAISGSESTNPPALLSFDFDFDTEVGAIIHDEVHYINDFARGGVWEQSILMTPPNIQLIMLSATLDSPERFCNWIENRHQSSGIEHKQVYLACSDKRPVPLTHTFYMCAPQALYKLEKNKEVQAKARRMIDVLHPIVSPSNVFDEVAYHRVTDTLKLLEKHKVHVKRSYVLNELCKHMVANNMLPGIVFILSKKQIETAVQEISVPLIGDDDDVPAVVAHACDQLLRSKLPNHEEFRRIPEYISMVSNLQKGLAVHHSGVHPIIREIVEILFPRFVKLLFATESVAVGIDLPIKTTIFTDIRKFDNTGRHMIPNFTYKQMSGRAGRRGKDTAGTAIHLVNLYRDMTCSEFRTMTTGSPQKLTSKFRISYSLVLNLIGSEPDTGSEAKSIVSRCTAFCSRSMIQHEIDSQCAAIAADLKIAKTTMIATESAVSVLRTPLAVITRYNELVNDIPASKNKKRKGLEREMTTIKDDHRYLLTDSQTVTSIAIKRNDIKTLEDQYAGAVGYLETQVGSILTKFRRDGYLSAEDMLTTKGHFAANLREGPCLPFAEMLSSHAFGELDACDLAVLFSCFAQLKVSEDDHDQYVSADEPTALKNVLRIAADTAASCADFENTERVYASDSGDSEISFDLMSLVREWYATEDEPSCKLVVQRAQQEKGILLGEFTKAVTKIVNIAAEVERVAEFAGDLALVGRLRDVSKNLLKFVVTNQSLYV